MLYVFSTVKNDLQINPFEAKFMPFRKGLPTFKTLHVALQNVILLLFTFQNLIPNPLADGFRNITSVSRSQLKITYSTN